MNALWWLAAAVVFGIIEVVTVDLVFLMFALGALSASAVSLLHPGLPIEVGVFAIASCLLLLLLRPWLKTHLRRSTPGIATNAQGLVGKHAEVVETVTSADGRVRLDGEIWSARTVGSIIAPGGRVVVEKIEGATAIVAPFTP